MKRGVCSAIVIVFVFVIALQSIVLADDISLLNNNTMVTDTIFMISSTGLATVGVGYDGYAGITTGAIITIKIEKRSLLLFWSDIVDETITVVGESYINELYYQLEDTGTYRCTVTYVVSGTGGADDVLTFEDTAKYE